VVMGVAGSGKSTIGPALADALGIPFVEGDEYHPVENVELMSRGIPLTDENRATWLRALAMRIHEAIDEGTGLVMSCSALKRSYRDRLRAEGAESGRKVQFIFLRGPSTLLTERLAGRRGHFMPTSLLESQLATLEEPLPDEDAWVCDISESPREIVADLVARASA
jgi:gluconokinase